MGASLGKVEHEHFDSQAGVGVAIELPKRPLNRPHGLSRGLQAIEGGSGTNPIDPVDVGDGMGDGLGSSQQNHIAPPALPELQRLGQGFHLFAAGQLFGTLEASGSIELEQVFE